MLKRHRMFELAIDVNELPPFVPCQHVAHPFHPAVWQGRWGEYFNAVENEYLVGWTVAAGRALPRTIIAFR